MMYLLFGSGQAIIWIISHIRCLDYLTETWYFLICFETNNQGPQKSGHIFDSEIQGVHMHTIYNDFRFMIMKYPIERFLS